MNLRTVFSAFCAADSRNREAIKIEERPSISPRHAPLLAAIYITHNDT